jgi:hypothetical protein
MGDVRGYKKIYISSLISSLKEVFALRGSACVKNHILPAKLVKNSRNFFN